MDWYTTKLVQSCRQCYGIILLCFASWQMTAISLLWGLLFAWVLIPVLQWSVIDAVWTGSVQLCDKAGACWIYATRNIDYLIYGLYPATEVWRINSIVVMMILWLGLVCRLRTLIWQAILWIFIITIAPVVSYYLALGGWGGLALVSPQKWGGLALNLIFSLFSITCAFPLGCLLAVVRKNKWGIYSFVARVLIDCIRGLPLVSLLFFASLVLPFFFNQYQGSGKLIRLFIIFTVFGAAYMAEAVRGGLQAVAKGQCEAAVVLGLTPSQTFIWIVFPQALEVALPSLINLAIALLKDSTLLSTIAVLDVVGMMQATTAQVEWMPYAVEAYLLVGVIFWCLCSMTAAIGRSVEKSIRILK